MQGILIQYSVSLGRSSGSFFSAPGSVPGMEQSLKSYWLNISFMLHSLRLCAHRALTCERLQVLLPQQVLSLVVQRTEELPARPTVQVLASLPLRTERAQSREEAWGTGTPGGLSVPCAPCETTFVRLEASLSTGETFQPSHSPWLRWERKHEVHGRGNTRELLRIGGAAGPAHNQLWVLLIFKEVALKS